MIEKILKYLGLDEALQARGRSQIQGFDADYVLTDRGYDSDPFVEMIQHRWCYSGHTGNRRQQRDYDQEIYKEQNLVERLLQKLKQFRRIATRYERLKRNYQSMLNLTCSMICSD